MFAQIVENPTTMNMQPKTILTPVRIAVVLGLGLGTLFTMLWPHFTGLVAWAMWPLGVAIASLGMGILSFRRSGETQWNLIFLGQALGVTAVAMIFLAWLL
ncbi:MAG: hypothetical protein R3E31_10765 [Chloroflexota bacterium]|nr:hypothetical protein [Anaerolineales bacterium]MCA9977516.1 hypothetical protein [Anaerolineales bacterium]MCB8967391.1 hypothetical protein [Ardenticatenaceae bacterium]